MHNNVFNNLPINFEEDYYCEIIHTEHLPNDASVFVATLTHPEGSNTDISIFSQKEWSTILAMSQVFEDEMRRVSCCSYWEYQQLSDEIKNSIYFLKYNCEFCDTGFNRLESLRGNKSDILDYILENSRDEPVTINKFRKWVIDSWSTIKENLKILSE